ncbi:MAG: c-type cytochrome domain-containing protein [Gammaproteobacteria bacterium]
MKTTMLRGGLLAGLCLVFVWGCQRAEEPEVSYSEDVRPILEKNCIECHVEGAAGYEASGFSMASYEDLMEGTKFGSVIKPEDSFTSALIMLVEGRADPSIQMPHGKEPLTEEEIVTLKTWVDQGAKNN